MYKKDIIPVYQPSLQGNEEKYVLDCLRSSWISSKGIYVQKFENEFAKKLEVNFATSVSNGTVALHLALLALGIGEGDEVIVPTLTYIASVNAIKYTGATPVFVDSLKDTWQINHNEITEKITSKTKAIMVVHLYGYPCNMNKILEISKDYNLYIVEDCAEAFGTKYEDKYVGSFGDIATFSFFGNKTITTGEGGMVVSNDKTLYERAVHLKGQGLAKYREYWHDIIGYNYRMTNICAAIGLAQLERSDEIVEKKIAIGRKYRTALKNLPLEMQYECEYGVNTVWMFSILVEEASQRDDLRNFLKENLIETRPIFYPIHTMPMYEGNFNSYHVAEDIGWRGINLPSWPDLTDDNINYIVGKISDFYNK